MVHILYYALFCDSISVSFIRWRQAQNCVFQSIKLEKCERYFAILNRVYNAVEKLQP